jgi:hypothetical protein
LPPRDKDPDSPTGKPPADAAAPTFPQPLQPNVPSQPLGGTLPGTATPIVPPTEKPKKGGGG